ncbi:MAG: hypothetical protein MUO26_01650 [Methanotrichaceae archaeon]|nr:hypothetical protein [Methanotrichaceae archaeon]
MKKILSLISAFIAIGICAAEVPNLVGNWTGTSNGYFNEDGIARLSENGSISLVITAQKDRLFTGNLTAMLNGEEIVKGLAGAIGLDGKTLYIVEFDQGYDIGTIISDDELELIYLADGKTGQAFIDRLHRS